MSAADKSCLRVQIGMTTAKFQSVSSTGTVTDLTGDITIPKFTANDEFIFEYSASALVLKKGTSGSTGIECARFSGAFTMPAGQYIGIGAYVPQHGAISPLPAPEFAGWTWV
jgi:hypothetical protein